MKCKGSELQYWRGVIAAVALSSASVPGLATDTGQSEEVIVTGQRSERELRVAVVQALVKVYKIYSSLNDDHLYDVGCEQSKPTGTLMGEVRCTPQYYTMLMRNYGEAFNIPPDELHERKQELDRRINLYIRQNQQLREAVQEYNKLNMELPDPARVTGN